jgi:hypothetical protein
VAADVLAFADQIITRAETDPYVADFITFLTGVQITRSGVNSDLGPLYDFVGGLINQNITAKTFLDNVASMENLNTFVSASPALQQAFNDLFRFPVTDLQNLMQLVSGNKYNATVIQNVLKEFARLRDNPDQINIVNIVYDYSLTVKGVVPDDGTRDKFINDTASGNYDLASATKVFFLLGHRPALRVLFALDNLKLLLKPTDKLTDVSIRTQLFSIVGTKAAT